MAETHTCPMCWFPFATAEDLAAHEDMERAVDWPIDGLERAVQGQARAARSDNEAT